MKESRQLVKHAVQTAVTAGMILVCSISGVAAESVPNYNQESGIRNQYRYEQDQANLPAWPNDLSGQQPSNAVIMAAPGAEDAQDTDSVPDAGIKVVVNDQIMKFDVEPTIEHDRVLVPLRAIFEALGAEVAWQSESNSIIARKDKIVVDISLYNPLAYVNGEAVVLDIPPIEKDGRTLVPLRFVAESMDAEVSWDAATQTASITQSAKSAGAVSAYCLQ